MTAADRVVVGFDGGPAGADAIAFGLLWAREAGDSVVVVTVHPGAAPISPGRVDAEWVAYEAEQADALLDEARALVGDAPGVTFHRVDAESAAHGVHDVVEERPESTPLVVLGARRTGHERRTFPGRTAVRLLHGSSVPVAVVPLGWAQAPAASLDRVLLAYVDTTDGHVALRHAMRMADAVDASLRIVTAVPDTRVAPAAGEPHVFASAQEADYRTALDAAVAEASASGLTVEGSLVEGQAHEVLADLDADDGDVLVVGSRGYGPVRSTLLGGVSSRVVRSAQLPVVVVPRAHR